MAENLPKYLPGFEPESLQNLVESFFGEVDKVFPNKTIVWSEWDHDRFDKAAGYLCKQLGYSNGKDFFSAYGYDVIILKSDKRESSREELSNSHTVEKNAEKFPLYSFVVVLSLITTFIAFLIATDIVSEDSLVDEVLLIPFLIAALLFTSSFIVSLVKMLVSLVKKNVAPMQKKKLLIYVAGIVLFISICLIYDLVFSSTNVQDISSVNSRINAALAEKNVQYETLHILYSEYDSLDEQDKARIENRTALQELFAQAVTEQITEYKESDIQVAMQLLKEYSDILSGEQITTCLVSIGRWGGLSEAEKYIKGLLKSPKSYYRYSATVSKPNGFTDGGYACYYDVEYSGTNSFGGEIREAKRVYVKYFIDITALEIAYAYVGDGGLSGIDAIIANPTK